MRSHLHLFVAFLVLGLALLPGASAQNWTISGDQVSWNNSWGLITVWPHTAKGYNYIQQNANLTWNLAANTLDFAFLFDFPISGNLSVYNPSTQSWENKTSLVTHTTYNSQDVYLIPAVAFAQGETKQVKWGFYIPPGSSGKWTLLIKLSSDSIATAFSSGRYLQLDPWWNTTRPFIENKGFEQFPSGGPSNWTWGGAAQNISCSSDLVNGSCSVRLNESAVLWYNNTNFDSTFQGKKFEFTALAKTNVTNGCRIGITDGDSSTYSNYAVGNNTWQRLTVTKTLHATLSDKLRYDLAGSNAGSNASLGCLYDEVGWGTVLNLSFDNGVQDRSVYNDSVVLTDVGSKTHPALSAGNGGNARSFNGSGAFVSSNHLGAFDFYDTDFSGDLFINASGSCAGDKYALALRPPTGAGQGFDLFCETGNNNLDFEVNNGTSSVYAATSGLNFGNGTKHWVYFEKDSYANQSRLFVDNVLRAFSTQRGGVGANSNNLSIGSHSLLNGGFWNFTADEIILRSFRLTAEERTNRYNFLTTSDTTPPNITHLAPANLTTYENRNFTVEVNASDNQGLSEVTVDFGGTNVTNNTALVNGSNFVTLTGLNDGNITYYTVAKDAAGNINGTAKRIVTIDTKNATLSAISSGTPSDRAATISFTADRSVNTTVTYGTVSGTYTTNTSNTTFSTGPKVSLTELSASTTYFYRIYTWNLASNFTESSEYNFTTKAIQESGGAGGGGGGGGPVVVTPFGQIVSTVNETVQKALNITSTRASILYITQDTRACWIHKISEVLPPDRPGSFDPCFPPNLYGGEAVQVAAIAYFTNGSVLSYTWWVSDPTLRIQPAAWSLDVMLAVGAYPLGVDMSLSSGGLFSFNRSVNVVAGTVPRLPSGVASMGVVKDTLGAGVSLVSFSPLSMAGGTVGSEVWRNSTVPLAGTEIKKINLLILLGGFAYVFFFMRGPKRPWIEGGR